MILNDVANGASLFIKAAATIDAEFLGHRDLHALDVVVVPDGLEQRIGKAHDEQVLYRLFAEKMVDAKNAGFVEDIVQRRVECLSGCEIAAKRFLNDDSCALRASRRAEPGGYGLEHVWRNGEIIQWVGSGTEHRADSGVRRSFAIIAVDIGDPRREALEHRFVNRSMMLQTVAGPRTELVDGPSRSRDANHRHFQLAAFGHRHQRGKDLLVRQVA